MDGVEVQQRDGAAGDLLQLRLVDLDGAVLADRGTRLVIRVPQVFLTAVMALLCLTGLIIWWPGIKNWKRALLISTSSGWKRINWDLHSAMGFWTLSIVFLFGITGSYLVFTMPFQK